MEEANRRPQSVNSWSGYPKCSLPTGKYQTASHLMPNGCYDCYSKSYDASTSPKSRMKKGYIKPIPPPAILQTRPYQEVPMRMAPPQSTQPQVWQTTQMPDGRIINTYLFPNVPNTMIPQQNMVYEPYPVQNNNQHYYYNPNPVPQYYYDSYSKQSTYHPPSSCGPARPAENHHLTKTSPESNQNRVKRDQSTQMCSKIDDKLTNKYLVQSGSKFTEPTERPVERVTDKRPQSARSVCTSPDLRVKRFSDETPKSSPTSTIHEQLKQFTAAISQKPKPRVIVKEEYSLKISVEEGRKLWKNPLSETSQSYRNPCKLRDDSESIDEFLVLCCGPHKDLIKCAEDELKVKDGGKKEETDKKQKEEEEADKESTVIPRQPLVSERTREMATTTGNYEFTDKARFRGMAYHKNPPNEYSPPSGRNYQARQEFAAAIKSRNYSGSSGGSWQPARKSH